MKMKNIDLTFSQFLHFLTKVEDYSDSVKCWMWKSARTKAGYGVITINRSVFLAHRISYTVLIGTIPEGLQLDHKCRVRACCNPWHMEPVTNRENCRRGLANIRQTLKTHCPQGHEYTKENTIIQKRGWRVCRICHRYYASKAYRETRAQ